MKKIYEITDIDCPICAKKLSTALNKNDGIQNAEIDFFTQRLTLETELPPSIILAIIKKTIKKVLPEATLGDEL